MRLTLRDENNRVEANRLKDEVALARHFQREHGMSRGDALRAAAKHVAENAWRYRGSGGTEVVSVTVERRPGDNGGPALDD